MSSNSQNRIRTLEALLKKERTHYLTAQKSANHFQLLFSRLARQYWLNKTRNRLLVEWSERNKDRSKEKKEEKKSFANALNRTARTRFYITFLSSQDSISKEDAIKNELPSLKIRENNYYLFIDTVKNRHGSIPEGISSRVVRYISLEEFIQDLSSNVKLIAKIISDIATIMVITSSSNIFQSSEIWWDKSNNTFLLSKFSEEFENTYKVTNTFAGYQEFLATEQKIKVSPNKGLQMDIDPKLKEFDLFIDTLVVTAIAVYTNNIKMETLNSKKRIATVESKITEEKILFNSHETDKELDDLNDISNNMEGDDY